MKQSQLLYELNKKNIHYFLEQHKKDCSMYNKSLIFSPEGIFKRKNNKIYKKNWCVNNYFTIENYFNNKNLFVNEIESYKDLEVHHIPFIHKEKYTSCFTYPVSDGITFYTEYTHDEDNTELTCNDITFYCMKSTVTPTKVENNYATKESIHSFLQELHNIV